MDEFQPDAVVYNAGTDILEGDPLGNLSITAQVRKVCINRSILSNDLLDDKQEAVASDNKLLSLQHNIWQVLACACLAEQACG